MTQHTNHHVDPIRNLYGIAAVPRIVQLRQEQSYAPGRMLDALRATLKLRNDAALARKLGLSPPAISKIRNGLIPVGAATLIRIHEIANISIADLRLLMGDRRKLFRVGRTPVETPTD